jgi:hypothetical protein
MGHDARRRRPSHSRRCGPRGRPQRLGEERGQRSVERLGIVLVTGMAGVGDDHVVRERLAGRPTRGCCPRCHRCGRRRRKSAAGRGADPCAASADRSATLDPADPAACTGRLRPRRSRHGRTAGRHDADGGSASSDAGAWPVMRHEIALEGADSAAHGTDRIDNVAGNGPGRCGSVAL